MANHFAQLKKDMNLQVEAACCHIHSPAESGQWGRLQKVVDMYAFYYALSSRPTPQSPLGRGF